MLFSSTVFLFLFFPILLILYYLPVMKRVRKNTILFIASILFYAYGEPMYVLLMLLSIAITYGTGKCMKKMGGYRRPALVAGIIYHLGILFYFKYFSFVMKQISRAFAIRGALEYHIELPIGISFFTFQMLSFLFDIYYGKVEYEEDLLNVSLYVSFFPQLIAGPIVRYSGMSGEIKIREKNKKDFQDGIERFVVGLGKKVLLADYLGIIADAIFASSSVSSIAMLNAWIGSIAFSLQIYFDFSGYSDMAIGLARCFGFHFEENFRYPYIADSVTEFWRRWHISLTNWFRDYVYIPLGGNKVSKKRHIVNIFTVWCLTGIWHGANWTFLLWGMMYFVFMIAERYIYHVQMVPKALRHLYTLVIVNVGWILFRAASVKDFVRFLGALLGLNGIVDMNSRAYFHNTMFLFAIAVIGTMPAVHRADEIMFERQCKIYYLLKYLILLGVFIMAIAASISESYSPFLYFNF